VEPRVQPRISRQYNYAGDYALDDSYRGYTIRVTRAAQWHAILLEPGTGAVLPTKATALLREGRGMALERARNSSISTPRPSRSCATAPPEGGGTGPWPVCQEPCAYSTVTSRRSPATTLMLFCFGSPSAGEATIT